jgi:hypothetical protein
MRDDIGMRDVIEACVNKGVTERRPVKGVRYVAFCVHPAHPGNLYALAIGHRDGEKLVIDLVREEIGGKDSCVILKRYHIPRIVGDFGDKAGALAHAVSGVIHELQLQ